MSMNDFQKYDPIWSYFSINGYSSCLLKDFDIVDEETHDLFVQLLCQNRKIHPALKSAPMYVDEFDTRAYHLLEQDDLFQLLEKMALPLQMRHFELKISDAKYSSLNLQKASENFRNKNFALDTELRWKTYFSLIMGTVQDLKIPYAKELKEIFPDLQQAEVENNRKAQVLEAGLKDSLNGIGEYFFQKELIWYAKEENSSNLYLRFSRLFNVSDVALTQEQLLEQELKALDVADRAIVWTQTNNTKAKTNAFDAAYEARQALIKSNADVKRVASHDAIKKSVLSNKEGRDSHEKN